MKRIGPWHLMPPDPERTCQTCAFDHPPELPHNQQSLYWLYSFYADHGRWPTWADAMAHCSDEMKAKWIEALAAQGIKVEDQ